MAIVSCPECGKKLKIADTSIGKKVKGPCGHVFVADMEEAVAPAPKPAPPKPVAAAPKPPVEPEKVYVSCTECGAKLKVATTSLGKKMKCPKCTAVFVANLPVAAPVKKAMPEVDFDEEEPAPKPKGKTKPAVQDDDMDDFLSFAQADAAAQVDSESDTNFGDEDDMPSPRGKAKPKKRWDEDEDDMPSPRGKPGKKPGKPTRSGSGDAKPIYPSRVVPTLLATVLLLAFGGLVGAIFFDVNVASMIGMPEPKVVREKAPDPLAKGKGKENEAKEKEKDKEKDKGKEPTDLSAEEKINIANDQIAKLTTATLTYAALNNNEFPATLNDLENSKDILLDPWKQPYQYDKEGPKNGGKKPDIWTKTPDNKVIGNWPAVDVTAKDKIEGAWKVESAEALGKPIKELSGARFVFADGKISGPDQDKPAYVVDESKDPKWLTMTPPGPGADKLETIYKIEGDRLFWCLPGPGEDKKPGPRPTSFDPKKAMLLILKRSSDAEAKAPGFDYRQSANNLKQIGLALHNFHDANKGFPAAVYDADGKPILSWRVAILPYIEQQELYKEFDLTKPWDDPHNKKLLAKMPKTYAVPGTDAGKGLTHYRALVGPGTVLEPTKDGKTPGRSLIALSDGSSNCIVIVEAKEPTDWTRPDDLPYDPKGPLPKFGVAPDGFNALFADGRVDLIPSTVTDEVLRPYLTCNNGMPRRPLDKEGKDKDFKDKDFKDKDFKDKDSKDKDKKNPDDEFEQTAKKLGGRLGRDLELPGKPVVEAYFDGSKITDDDLKMLAGLKQMRKLSLASTKINGAGLKDLAALENLEELDLGFTMIADEAVKELAALKKLKVLSVLNAKITDSGLITIADLTQLEELNAGQNKITAAGVKELAKLKELRRLELGNTGTNDEALKAIGELDKLEKLTIYGTAATDAGMKDVAKLKNLQELAFSFNITDAGMKELAGLTELRSLHIVFSKVKDEGLKTIGGFKKLQMLELSSLEISDAGLKELAGLDQLKSLHLDNTKVTDAGLKELAALKQLELLTLRNTKVSADAVDELKKALPKCQIFAK